MKILMIALVVVLSGCGDVYIDELNTGPVDVDTGRSENIEVVEVVEVEQLSERDNLYIIAGQSNAKYCNWGYLTELTGAKYVNIAISGASIATIFHGYKTGTISGLKPKGIIFVHGETDGQIATNLTYYNTRVEEYRGKLSLDVGYELPLHISSVGYYDGENDDDFDALRLSVEETAKNNEFWSIDYDDAKYYRDWGMLVDAVHFSKEGCQIMIEVISSRI